MIGEGFIGLSYALNQSLVLISLASGTESETVIVKALRSRASPGDLVLYYHLARFHISSFAF